LQGNPGENTSPEPDRFFHSGYPRVDGNLNPRLFIEHIHQERSLPMPLLEAFLALALTMLSLAMIASLGVEFVHRAVGTRAKGLKTMLEEFYDSELKPLIKLKAGETEAQVKTAFINQMTTNPLVKDKAAAPFLKRNLADLQSLSTEDLLKRLANTNLGKDIKSKTEQEIDEFVDSISRTYEAFGVAATELFKRNARIISYIAGIVVAIGLNVNAILLFQMYLDDPQVRTQAVAQAETVVKRYEQRLDELESAEAATNGEDAEDAAESEKAQPSGFEHINEAQEQIDAMKDDIKELQNLGVKIGWTASKAPRTIWNDSKQNVSQNSSHGNNAGTFGRMLSTWKFWEWFFGLIGTGLLIGLGGPFWFDVVRKVSQVLQVVRGGTPPPPAAGEAVPTAEADPVKPLKETFKRTGELPDNVKAKARLAEATRAATEADQRVIATAEALKRTREAAGDQPDEKMEKAIDTAKASLEVAVLSQKANHEAKQRTEEALLNPNR
jgi:hypothetical protein